MSRQEKLEAFLSELQKSETGLFGYAPMLKNKPFDPAKDIVLYGGPYWGKEEVLAAVEALLFGSWISAGEMVTRFEMAFSKTVECKTSLMVNSGSSANLVLMTAAKERFGWNEKSEIITTAAGFPATLSAIVQAGMTPSFVDIDWSDLNLDLAQFEKKIGPNTVAVFLSPALGCPPDMDKVIALCEKKKIALLLDGCDSLGTKWRGKPLQSYAVASSCSFYPAHHITTGEGGMVSSNDAEFMKIARSVAWWGRDCYCVGKNNLLPNGTCGKRFDRWLEGSDAIIDHKYLYSYMGYNLKPLDLQGAIGLQQIQKLETIHRLRKENKAALQDALEKHVAGVRVVREPKNSDTSWFGVPILCETRELKESLVQHLEKNRVQTRSFFAGNLLAHPAFRDLDDAKKYPKSTDVLTKVFFLGCAPTLTPEMISYICEVIAKFSSAKLKVAA